MNNSLAKCDAREAMECFSRIHGCLPQIGQRVRVSKDNQYASDWPDIYLITGIQWDWPRRRIDVTLADDWEDTGTDGWRLEDLMPLADDA